MTTTASTIAAFLSIGLISLLPNLILLLLPNYQAGGDLDPFSKAVLSLGSALAAGGLLGDVFLHVLPESFSNGHDDDIGLVVLAGFFVFLAFDVIVRSTESAHDHNGDGGHDAGVKENGEFDIAKTKRKHDGVGLFSPTVILSLAADSLHNFTDGLAVGATFAASSPSNDGATESALSMLTVVLSQLKSRGGLVSISVMLHEIPHELGDFSVLVNHGFSKKQAIFAQFGTAVAAFMGTAVGLMATHVGGLGNKMLPFTSGGFVYLAAVTILPEVLEERTSARLRILQLLFFGLGIAFMQAVAIIEHGEGGEHSHAHGHGGSHHDHHHAHHIHGEL